VLHLRCGDPRALRRRDPVHSETKVLSVLIFDLKESGDVGAIAVLSLAMVGITTVVIVIASGVGGGRDIGRRPARAAG
jgi:iron(III) transport system permease protein